MAAQPSPLLGDPLPTAPTVHTLKFTKGAECRTPFCQFFGGSADFEVLKEALKEETDGIFLSYTVVQGSTPSVCDALAKSRNEFYQAPRVTKLFCISSPLNRSQCRTYCKCQTGKFLKMEKRFFSNLMKNSKCCRHSSQAALQD